MKKKVLIALIGLTLTLSMVLGVLAGCGPATPATTNPTSTGPAPTSTGPAPTSTKPTVKPTATGEVITWRWQTGSSAGTPSYFLFKRTVDAVKTASGGRLVIEVHPAGSIVASTELMDAAMSGAVEMTGPLSNGNWAGKDDRFYLSGNIAGGMGLLTNFCYVYYVNPDGENPYQKYNDQLYADMGVVKLQCQTGIRYTEAEYIATKPLVKPADFKGLSFRALGWTSQTALAFGAKGVFIPNTDVYSALQTGVVDAAELGDVFSNYQQGYYDICKYTGFPGIHTLTENSDVQVSKAAWDKLPDDLRAILEMCVREQGVRLGAYENVEAAKLMASGELQKKGVTVIYQSPEMQNTWRTTSWKLADDYSAKNPKFAEWWASFKDFQIMMDKYFDLQTPDYGPDYPGNKEMIQGIKFE